MHSAFSWCSYFICWSPINCIKVPEKKINNTGQVFTNFSKWLHIYLDTSYITPLLRRLFPMQNDSFVIYNCNLVFVMSPLSCAGKQRSSVNMCCTVLDKNKFMTVTGCALKVVPCFCICHWISRARGFLPSTTASCSQIYDMTVWVLCFNVQDSLYIIRSTATNAWIPQGPCLRLEAV